MVVLMAGEGEGAPTPKRTGRQILADMALLKDEVHARIIEQIQTDCDHAYPFIRGNDGRTLCCGCMRPGPGFSSA